MVNKEFLNKPEYIPTEGLTIKEDQQLTELLKKWSGGQISTPVFTEMARIIPQSVVELTVFRKNNGVLETLIIPRPENDIVWPGMTHTPGTAMRATDFKTEGKNPLEAAIDRIKNRELHCEFAYTPIYGGNFRRLVERGAEIGEAYFTELSNKSMESHFQWYPVDKLSENPNFIQHQVGHIKTAAEAYKNWKNSQRTNLP